MSSERIPVCLLRLPLSSHLPSINSAISCVLAAQSHVSEALICELTLHPSLDTRFHYLVALLGHLYMHTYEALGPKVVLVAPQLLGVSSAVERDREIQGVFDNPDFLLENDCEHVRRVREERQLPPVEFVPLKSFRVRQFPPFNPQYVSCAIPKYEKVVLGGTFDYLHPGHMSLLSCLSITTTHTAFLALTTSALLRNKKHSVFLQSYRMRERDLRFVMRYLAPHITVSIFPLMDPIGPAATEAWDGIVLSQEAVPTGESINPIRKGNNLPPLSLIVVDLVQLGTEKVSSSDVRALLEAKSGGNGDCLRGVWLELCERLRVAPHSALDWWSEVAVRSSRYDRYYHTLEEIASVWKTISDFNLQGNTELELAVWFHRAVYYPERCDNAEQSAKLCEVFIEECGIEGFGRVPEYIRAVGKGEPVTNDRTELLLLDLSLAVFGQSAAVYRDYSVKIQQEGSFRSDFVSYRHAFLSSLLARSQIYYTEEFRSRLEANARRNAQWEIARLSTDKS